MPALLQTSDGSRHECVIGGVTVYRDRAEVRRRLQWPVGEDVQEVRVTGLSASVDPTSIRVTGGHNLCTILEVSPSFVASDAASDRPETPESLLARLEALARSRAQLEAECATVRKFAAGVVEAAAGNAECSKASIKEYLGGSAQEGVAAVRKMLRRRLVAAGVRIRRIEAEEATLVAALAATENSSSKPRPVPSHSHLDVVISLYAEEAQELELELSYQVTCASWVPQYDVRVPSGLKELVLTYYGVVQQATGECWDEVPLTLSTAEPASDGCPPLPTNILTFRSSASLSSQRAGGEADLDDASSTCTCVSDVCTADPPCAATTAQAGGADGGRQATCRYQAVSPATVSSGNRPTRVPIAVMNLAADFAYEVAPRMASEVFLVASARNEDTSGSDEVLTPLRKAARSLTLLPGTAQVFIDGVYKTSTLFPHVAVQEQFSLSLGADPNIAVDCQPVSATSDRQKVISMSRSATYEFITRIYNRKSSPVHVSVLQQLPCPLQEKIRVKLISTDYVVRETGDEHTLAAAILVASGSSASSSFSYSIDWPNGWTIDQTVVAH